jgi:SAM-dependent methyltransferase
MTGPAGYTPQGLGARVRSAAAERGWGPVAGAFARWGLQTAAGLPWAARGAHGTFTLRGERYGYLHRLYKRSWVTERAVEVPVVQRIVDAAEGKRVLEVGHVLGHYRRQRADHVVVDLADLGPFDLVVAISTVEHVGWDEAPRDPARAPAAVNALADLLAPGGRLVLTVPAGYNPALDEALRSGEIALSDSAALRRVDGTQRWEEVAPADVWSAPYDFLLYSARGVLFAFVDR